MMRGFLLGLGWTLWKMVLEFLPRLYCRVDLVAGTGRHVCVA